MLYSECYIRFGGVDYDPNALDNKAMHLTNNCVVAHYDTDDKIAGNMWSNDEFSEYLAVNMGGMG